MAGTAPFVPRWAGRATGIARSPALGVTRNQPVAAAHPGVGGGLLRICSCRCHQLVDHRAFVGGLHTAARKEGEYGGTSAGHVRCLAAMSASRPKRPLPIAITSRPSQRKSATESICHMPLPTAARRSPASGGARQVGSGAGASASSGAGMGDVVPGLTRTSDASNERPRYPSCRLSGWMHRTLSAPGALVPIATIAVARLSPWAIRRVYSPGTGWNASPRLRYTTSSGGMVISTPDQAGDRRANLVLRALIDEMLERVRGLNATPSTMTTDERSRAEAELESIMARVRRYAALRDQQV